MSSEPPHPLGSPLSSPSLVSLDGEAIHTHPKFQESLKFLDEVKRRFETTQPEVYPAFIQALSTFNQAAPRTREEADRNLAEIHATARALLRGHGDLLERFESGLPAEYLHKRAKSEGQI
ncbi:het domain protein [Colletotrichum sojae]|uniref:Het domain protein n=1 Tax=Colletotrichum sojae TaxID=2175907 RepID=A0A8H6IQQ5_9PEZI|nr:het domain protein [Colletotrichum sojae]